MADLDDLGPLSDEQKFGVLMLHLAELRRVEKRIRAEVDAVKARLAEMGVREYETPKPTIDYGRLFRS